MPSFSRDAYLIMMKCHNVYKFVFKNSAKVKGVKQTWEEVNNYQIQVAVMLKTRPLCTGTESNLRDRVLGEIEKKSFILPSKGEHSGLMSQKLCVPTQEDSVRSFIPSSRVGLLTSFRCMQGLHSFNPASGMKVSAGMKNVNTFHLLRILNLQRAQTYSSVYSLRQK